MSSHTIQVEFTRVDSYCYSHPAPKAEILFGTGAGFSDATLGDSTYAVWGFLNATVMQFNITTFPWSFFMPSDTTYDGTSPFLDTTLASRVVVGCPVPSFLIVHHRICWPKRFLAVNSYRWIITNRANLERTIRANKADSFIAWYPVRLNAGTYSTMFSINETGLQWDTSASSSFGGWLGTSHPLIRVPFPLYLRPFTYWRNTDQARFR